MSDNLEAARIAVETYFIANWTSTPYGLSQQTFTPVANSVCMTIKNGEAKQGTVGRTLNVINNIGVLMFQIFTAGGTGEAAANGYAESLMTLFFGKTLDSTGALVTSGAQTVLIRFSPPEIGDARHPYISNSMPVTPFLMTNVNVPYLRYQLR